MPRELSLLEVHVAELSRPHRRERKDPGIYVQVKKSMKCRLGVALKLECPSWEKPLGVETVGTGLDAPAVASLLDPLFVFFSIYFRILQSLLRSRF